MQLPCMSSLQMGVIDMQDHAFPWSLSRQEVYRMCQKSHTTAAFLLSISHISRALQLTHGSSRLLSSWRHALFPRYWGLETPGDMAILVEHSADHNTSRHSPALTDILHPRRIFSHTAVKGPLSSADELQSREDRTSTKRCSTKFTRSGYHREPSHWCGWMAWINS